MPKKRCWSDDYVQYGFTCMSEKDGIQQLQCVLRYKIFSNCNLKPLKLSEHFKKLHAKMLDILMTTLAVRELDLI